MTAAAWPSWLVGNAFAIYVMHPVFLRLMLEPQRMLPARPSMCFVEWGIAVVLSILLAIGLRKTLPGVAHLVFGGR